MAKFISNSYYRTGRSISATLVSVGCASYLPCANVATLDPIVIPCHSQQAIVENMRIAETEQNKSVLHVWLVAVAALLCCNAVIIPKLRAETHSDFAAQAASVELNHPYFAKIVRGEPVCDIGLIGMISMIGSTVTRVHSEDARDGIRPGDKIVAINGYPAADVSLPELLGRFAPDDEMTFVVNRNGTPIRIDTACSSNLEVHRGIIDMLEAAVDREWPKCLTFARQIQDLVGNDFAYLASWRFRCSEAIRCNPRCARPRRRHAINLLELNNLIIEEASLSGHLSKYKPRILNDIGWLKDNRFRVIASQLEAALRAAESSDID